MSNTERLWYLIFGLVAASLMGAFAMGIFWVWVDFLGWSPYILVFLQSSSQFLNRLTQKRR